MSDKELGKRDKPEGEKEAEAPQPEKKVKAAEEEDDGFDPEEIGEEEQEDVGLSGEGLFDFKI